jgi:hypothetical protein
MKVSFIQHNTLAYANHISAEKPSLSLPSFPPVATNDGVTLRSCEVEQDSIEVVSAPKRQTPVVEESVQDRIHRQYVPLETFANYADL